MKGRTAVLTVMTALLANMNAVLAVAGGVLSNGPAPFARRADRLAEGPAMLADLKPLLTIRMGLLRRRTLLLAEVTTSPTLRTPALGTEECSLAALGVSLAVSPCAAFEGVPSPSSVNASSVYSIGSTSQAWRTLARA